MADVFDHGQDGGARVLGVYDDAGVAISKHTEYFIGKTLSHGSYVTKVEADFSELLQIGQQTFCL